MGTRLGLMALRLERMADENVALYNIMGIEAGGSNGQTLGQMAVELPDGTTELKFDRAWMVEPLEPLKGHKLHGSSYSDSLRAEGRENLALRGAKGMNQQRIRTQQSPQARAFVT